MISRQSPNYLRSNRKRLSLSQDEVAFLLGARTGAKISRYEHFVRVPSLETALACEVVFQRSVSELFGGLYQQAEKNVARRAKTLLQRTNHSRFGAKSQNRDAIIRLANKQ